MATLSYINYHVKELYKKFKLKYEIESRGNPNGDIIVLVDNPTLIDIKNNSLMSGNSSRILFKFLAENKIDFERLYITSTCRHYEVLDEKSHEKINKGESNEYYKTIVEYEMSQLSNAKFMLCLGSLSSGIYNKEHSISKLRGTFEIAKEWKHSIFYSINPAIIGRDSRLIYMLKRDVEKFSSSFQKDRKTITVCNFLKHVGDIHTFFEGIGEIAFDIETCSNDVACISFYSNERSATILFVDENLERVFGENEKSIINAIDEGLRKSKIITQNGLFDVTFLSKKWNVKPYDIYKDTMILHGLYFPSFPHSLQFLNSIYGDLEYYKHEGKDWKKNIDINKFALYNLKDAYTTFKAAEQLEYNELIMNEYNILTKCASRGMVVNAGEISKTKNNIDLDYAKSLSVWKMDAESKNLVLPRVSMKSIKDYIEKHMKIKLQKGKETLQHKIQALMDWKYIGISDKNLLRAMLFLIKNKDNIKKTKDIVNKTVHIWYPYFNITKLGQAPGRIFVEDSFSQVKGEHNMFRTYPKNFRARDGMAFVKIEPKFLTVRMTAEKCHMSSFEEIFRSLDPVEANLRMMFPQIKEVNKVDKYPNGNRTHYWISKKMLEHGNYPIDIKETAQRWGITTSELEGVSALYKKVHPEINKLNDNIIKSLTNNGYITSLSGMRFNAKPDLDENDYPMYLQFVWEDLARQELLKLAEKEYTVYIDEDIIIWEVPEEQRELIAGNIDQNLFNVTMSKAKHNTFTSLTGGKPIHYFEEL